MPVMITRTWQLCSPFVCISIFKLEVWRLTQPLSIKQETLNYFMIQQIIIKLSSHKPKRISSPESPRELIPNGPFHWKWMHHSPSRSVSFTVQYQHVSLTVVQNTTSNLRIYTRSAMTQLAHGLICTSAFGSVLSSVCISCEEKKQL